MSFLRPPKQPAPLATPDPADAANRVADERKRTANSGNVFTGSQMKITEWT